MGNRFFSESTKRKLALHKMPPSIFYGAVALLLIWLHIQDSFPPPCCRSSHASSFSFLFSFLLSLHLSLTPPLLLYPPLGDSLPIHHFFHGYLAGFTIRPGSLESREVIECLYACREGLDYSDFDSLGKGMKVYLPLPSGGMIFLPALLAPWLGFPDRACSCPPESLLMSLDGSP